jgi:hypothetical protein
MIFKTFFTILFQLLIWGTLLIANNCPKWLPIPYTEGLHNIVPIYDITVTKSDLDCDGLIDILDTDIDGVGISNSTEQANGTNPYLVDTDGDGVSDALDAFPLDPRETKDTDGDGIGDNADSDINYTIIYTEDATLNRLNPDRGFYDADYVLSEEKNYNMFEDVRQNGYSLVYAPLDLKDYVTTSILPDSLIDTISKNLEDANTSRVKLIFRVKYRNDISKDDPLRDIIFSHFQQLKPLLQSYKNIISVVQAGTIGAWGEWHSFTGEYASDNVNYTVNRREIIDTLVTMFPSKYVQIRTPMHKELLYGSSTYYAEEGNEGKITEEIAFSDDVRAKIGHHNDCVLSSETDTGTYPSDNIEFWKNYVVNDTLYAPIGGETCGIGEGDDASLSSCSNAIAEFTRLHYSFLNDSYHPDVLQKWKDEGCYNEIRDNLGYRFVADRLNVAQDNSHLLLILDLQNKGYTAPFMPIKTTLILKSDSHLYSFSQEIDLRRFMSQTSQKIVQNISLNSIEKGSYCLYLKMEDSSFGIRLTNSDIWWDNINQMNRLACDIVIE